MKYVIQLITCVEIQQFRKKKLVKPLEKCFFGPNLHIKGVIMDHAQDEKKFLVKITKTDHQLSESIFF